jgi:hypothetical protein
MVASRRAMRVALVGARQDIFSGTCYVVSVETMIWYSRGRLHM